MRGQEHGNGGQEAGPFQGRALWEPSPPHIHLLVRSTFSSAFLIPNLNCSIIWAEETRSISRSPRIGTLAFQKVLPKAKFDSEF